jgi:hypothetical protein
MGICRAPFCLVGRYKVDAGHHNALKVHCSTKIPVHSQGTDTEKLSNCFWPYGIPQCDAEALMWR